MSDHKYCVKSLRHKKISDNETHEVFCFGEALEKVYPLLRIIFANLPYEDLISASLVNNTWNKYSIEELKKRNNASWLSLSRSKTSQLIIEKSNNFKYDSVAFAFIFYNYHEIKMHRYICVHDEPMKRMTFSEYLINEIVPKDIDFWVFSCTQVYSPVLSNGSNCSFTGLFIPNIPNINVKQFITPCDNADHIFDEKNISQEERIHCILLFTLSYPNLILKKITKELVKRENFEGIAIGGGVISNGIKPFQKDITNRVFRSNTLFCIALTEDKNNPAEFDAFSVVISSEVNFEQELIYFKNRINVREHSFAIRICCAAKDAKDIENTLFNKVFPNTFLVGLDADGEIGRDKFQWQPEDNTPEIKKQKKRHCLYHQYTTIIVIFSWGRKIVVSD